MHAKKKISSAAKLNKLTPSGQKDQSFFEQVYAIARQIPKGRVTSYGAIARCLGSGKSARMVGWAMRSSSSIRPKVPAHRVVNSAGLLSGKHAFDPPEKMQQLLEKEGIGVKNDQIVDFKNRFWDPLEDL